MNNKHYRKRNHILKISLLFLIVLLAAVLYRTCQLNAESPGTTIKPILTELSNHTTTDSSENWELLLVNRTHKIPAHYSVTLTELSNGKKVGQRIYPSLQQMFDDALRQVGMEKFRGRKMKNLSGGMLRRVGIAQAMLNDPRILVLDEPTAGLDPNERIRFRNLISELSEERLVVLSTHIVSDIEYIANDIMLMKDGKLFYTGTAEELLDSMKEKVWLCEVPRKLVDRYMKNYLVGNIRTTEHGAELRIIAKERPTQEAAETEKNLEDAFLLYFGERSEEKKDV